MDEELLMEEDIPEVPSKTYKIVNGRVAGYIDELEAMRQAVEKVLQTERFENLIYTENYGVEFNDLIGESMDLVKAEVERIVTESFLSDDRIIGVENFEIVEENKDILTIAFDVATIFGTVDIGREVNVVEYR